MRQKLEKYRILFQHSFLLSLRERSALVSLGLLTWILVFAYSNIWKGGELRTETEIGKHYIWYLVLTQLIVLGSPNILTRLQTEIGRGSISSLKPTPIHYFLLLISESVGECLVRLIWVGIMAFTMGWWCAGPPDFQMSGSVLQWFALFFLFILTLLINSFYIAPVAMMRFWTGNISPFLLAWERIRWIGGGLLLPLSALPDEVKKYFIYLPFRWFLYEPVSLFFKFSWQQFKVVMIWQLGIACLLYGLCSVLLSLGIRHDIQKRTS